MPYLNPARMSADQRKTVAKWLERNGCRHWIALEPVIVRGQWAEYTAICRKDSKSLRRVRVSGDEFVRLGKRRVRIRFPLGGI